MAYVGVRKPYFFPMDTAHPGKFLDPMFIGKATTFEETANTSEATLYADDVLAESDRGVTSYGLTLGTSDIPHEVAEAMFGHAISSDVLTSNADDAPPYGGFAVIGKKQVDGVISYEARVYPKTQWSEPGLSVNTRGESTEFQTQSTSGIAMADANGDLRYLQEFDTEAAAITFITGKFPKNS